MKQIEFSLTEEYIELIRLIKLLRISESGGQAKQMVENKQVVVNGAIELRKRAKLRRGEIVVIGDYRIKIQ